jgi:retinol dehydrogenase-12
VLSASGTGVTTYSVHPGVVATELNRHVRDTWFSKIFVFIGPLFGYGISPKDGAKTSLYCCLEPTLANETGLYYRYIEHCYRSGKLISIDEMISLSL